MSDEQTVEFDVTEVVGGNAESIVAKLSSLLDGQLIELAAAESALSKPRASVLAAIQAEQKGRADVAAQIDPTIQAAQGDAAAAQAARIAELEAQVKDRDQRIANLEAAIAAKASNGKAPKALQMAQVDALPDLAAMSEVRVICVGEDDRSLAGLPPLLFGSYQFSPEGDGIVLDAPIAFARELPETEVHALYLTDGGKKGLRANLVQPITVGGGKAMELPKGHIRFVPVSPPPAQAA